MPSPEALAQAIDRLVIQLAAYDAAKRPAASVQFRQALATTGLSINLADWLACQPGYRKFYWRSRDGQHEVATLGIAQSRQDNDAMAWLDSGALSASPLTYYWISGFDTDAQSWESYPRQLLFLPQIELRREAQQCWLSVNLAADTPTAVLILLLKQLRPRVTPMPAPLRLTDREDYPTQATWRGMIARAQQQFSRGHLQKVVLARKTSLRSRADLCFWSVFRQWRQEAVNCYQIALQLTPSSGFISFTPERLYRREGVDLATEALAGTLPLPQPLAATEDAARVLSDAPLIDAKTRHEHALVVQDITEKLQSCALSVSRSGATVLLRQRNLQHLYQPIQARLKHPDMDAELIRTLHPTAAMGGLPAQPAKAFISQQEGFSRGWFAGCCGPVSAQKTELAIGIRSAQVEANRLHLFAGAGIVPGSKADQEWQELEQKIALPLSQFDTQMNPLLNPQFDQEACYVPDSASIA